MVTSALAPRLGPPIQLSLVRSFELRIGESIVPVVHSAQRLVAFVALQERAVGRVHASGVLWTDVSEQRANASLRSALCRTPAPGGRAILQASSTHVWLHPDVDVDVKLINSRAEAILDRSAVDAAVPELGRGVHLFGEDLLADWYEDWVLVERERFRQLRLHALEAICERLTDAGDFALALQAGLAAVACEPLRESAQRQVVRTHLKEGNLTEALRQYRSFATLLADEVGARPSPAMGALFGDLLETLGL